MGQTTSNISIYIPNDGETLYGQSFAQGMLNVDQHDHSGPPTKGVPLSASGLADGSVTAAKLNNVPPTSVADPVGGLGFNPTTNALTTEGLLLALFDVSTTGFLVQSSIGPNVANSRTLTGTTGDDSSVLVNITNPQGIAGDPTFSVPLSFVNKVPSAVNIITISTSGTYTPTAGMIYCIIEVIGAGGGGGGAATSSAAGNGTGSSGGGGGSGGYSKGTFTAATIGASQTVTIGVAGTGGSPGANTGGTGGTTSVGSLIQATGGEGGTGVAAGISGAAYGGAGGVGSLGQLNMAGNYGGLGWTDNVSSSNLGLCGQGAAAFFGGQIYQDWLNNTGQTVGTPGTSFGGGGNGGITLKGGTDIAGGAGYQGVVVITEYIHP